MPTVLWTWNVTFFPQFPHTHTDIRYTLETTPVWHSQNACGIHTHCFVQSPWKFQHAIRKRTNSVRQSQFLIVEFRMRKSKIIGKFVHSQQTHLKYGQSVNILQFYSIHQCLISSCFNGVDTWNYFCCDLFTRKTKSTNNNHLMNSPRGLGENMHQFIFLSFAVQVYRAEVKNLLNKTSECVPSFQCIQISLSMKKQYKTESNPIRTNLTKRNQI